MNTEETEKSILSTVADYGTRLFAYIKNKVPTTEDAEDILQEVWYQYSKIEDLDALGSVSGWLYSVSKNKITDLYRKKKDDHLEDYSYTDEDGLSEIREILLMDISQSPELGYFKELFWEALFSALDELPDNQKQAFVLNELEAYSLQEIADLYQTNIKTIISRKGYAVKHLRVSLQFLYDELI